MAPIPCALAYIAPPHLRIRTEVLRQMHAPSGQVSPSHAPTADRLVRLGLRRIAIMDYQHLCGSTLKEEAVFASVVTGFTRMLT